MTDDEDKEEATNEAQLRSVNRAAKKRPWHRDRHITGRVSSQARGWRWRLLVIMPLFIVVAFGSYAGYVYAVSPEVIRHPKLEHLHFRMQVVVNGRAEDFGHANYQTGYSKDNCNILLPNQPIHFHDNKDQFVHIHWEDMTGGLVLKYYGWNYIGGMDDALGYRLDNLKEVLKDVKVPKKVPIHGHQLPGVPKDAKFYVYTGDKNSYQEKKFNDFVNQDLERFFNKTSSFPDQNAEAMSGQQSGLLNALFPKAYAHGAHTTVGDASKEEELKRINNLIGNVVIFVQKDKPTDQQVKDRFNQLVPLSESTCAG